MTFEEEMRERVRHVPRAPWNVLDDTLVIDHKDYLVAETKGGGTAQYIAMLDPVTATLVAECIFKFRRTIKLLEALCESGVVIDRDWQEEINLVSDDDDKTLAALDAHHAKGKG